MNIGKYDLKNEYEDVRNSVLLVLYQLSTEKELLHEGPWGAFAKQTWITYGRLMITVTSDSTEKELFEREPLRGSRQTDLDNVMSSQDIKQLIQKYAILRFARFCLAAVRQKCTILPHSCEAELQHQVASLNFLPRVNFPLFSNSRNCKAQAVLGNVHRIKL